MIINFAQHREGRELDRYSRVLLDRGRTAHVQHEKGFIDPVQAMARIDLAVIELLRLRAEIADHFDNAKEGQAS